MIYALYTALLEHFYGRLSYILQNTHESTDILFFGKIYCCKYFDRSGDCYQLRPNHQQRKQNNTRIQSQILILHSLTSIISYLTQKVFLRKISSNGKINIFPTNIIVTGLWIPRDTITSTNITQSFLSVPISHLHQDNPTLAHPLHSLSAETILRKHNNIMCKMRKSLTNTTHCRVVEIYKQTR